MAIRIHEERRYETAVKVDDHCGSLLRSRNEKCTFVVCSRFPHRKAGERGVKRRIKSQAIGSREKERHRESIPGCQQLLKLHWSCEQF